MKMPCSSPSNVSRSRRVGPHPRGLSAVEAVISVTLLSVASIAMLQMMSIGTTVSDSEMAETDQQDKARLLVESLHDDLTVARIGYMAQGGLVQSDGTLKTGSAGPAFLCGTDDDPSATSRPCFLLLQYQVPLTDSTGNSTFNSSPGISAGMVYYGADDPNKALPPPGGPPTPYGWFDVCFRATKQINEADPALPLPNPTALYGNMPVEVIQADIDGDGQYNSVFFEGVLLRRYNPPSVLLPTTANKPAIVWGAASEIGSDAAGTSPPTFNVPFVPGKSGTGYLPASTKVYPGRIILPVSGNQPLNEIFTWVEPFYSVAATLPPTIFSSGWNDNVFHTYTTHGTGTNIPALPLFMYVPYTTNGQVNYNNFKTVSNDGINIASPNPSGPNQWDPIIHIQARILQSSKYQVRQKVATTSFYMSNQPNN